MQRAKIKMQNEKLKKIRQAKEQEYGPFGSNMNNIGKIWTALLGLDRNIPGWMVANMYVAAKLLRTNNTFKQDTYDDAANYLYQAELMQKVDQAKDDYEMEKIISDQMTSSEPDANTRMHDALKAEHKTNYPKDEPDEQ